MKKKAAKSRSASTRARTSAPHSRNRSSRQAHSETPPAPDLVSLRQSITNIVCSEAVEMVETTIEQVQSGHYQALKYLFEMIGLYPATAVKDTPDEDSLAEILLHHLEISQPPGSARN